MCIRDRNKSPRKATRNLARHQLTLWDHRCGGWITWYDQAELNRVAGCIPISFTHLLTVTQRSNCRREGWRGWTHHQLLPQPPKMLLNYVLGGQLYIIHIQFTSHFWLSSDHRKVQPPQLIFTRESSYCFQRLLAIAVLSVCLSLTKLQKNGWVKQRITAITIWITKWKHDINKPGYDHIAMTHTCRWQRCSHEKMTNSRWWLKIGALLLWQLRVLLLYLIMI